ncbi:hypothetical protein CYMTET_8027 [Cymbomonas tetramitiformis]|uniref:Uncharacterized protein n=1 Tax=Cymbomonas tetramitiformis TaxID=36881 RepID=A0AAE0KU12_9CHLO|nr:hypothetical protein CYMTET_41130 [Cymbomonas tetramitiformis]KAK3250857.1 hypothetical protein CYMTET_39785 [Cymbomonas tetramitiformis]KAK3260510.1 hypothetical protein CYMTET_30532 [Cymbomonas tetramitiformis]KAK3278690.1 hypothetical protein CYMTET_13387 [Cymbomonas tetramitiformis]KAK3284316.1 hypothetical protein CYMTET_8027 [Cymbomonas tetramitiformis]
MELALTKRVSHASIAGAIHLDVLDKVTEGPAPQWLLSETAKVDTAGGTGGTTTMVDEEVDGVAFAVSAWNGGTQYSVSEWF